jgi:hypothetical protein
MFLTGQDSVHPQQPAEPVRLSITLRNILGDCFPRTQLDLPQPLINQPALEIAMGEVSQLGHVLTVIAGRRLRFEVDFEAAQSPFLTQTVHLVYNGLLPFEIREVTGSVSKIGGRVIRKYYCREAKRTTSRRPKAFDNFDGINALS